MKYKVSSKDQQQDNDMWIFAIDIFGSPRYHKSYFKKPVDFRWDYKGGIFYFKYQEDYVLFCLRWL